MENLTDELHCRTETELPIIEETKQQLLLTLDRSYNYKERKRIKSYKKYQRRKGKTIYETKEKTKKIVSPKNKKKKGCGRVKLGDGHTTNTEHLNPRSRGGSNHRNNLLESNIKEHQDKHKYLGNKLLHEQLQQVIGDNFTVMHEETRDIITKAINNILGYFIKKEKFYNPKTFKNPRFIPTTL